MFSFALAYVLALLLGVFLFSSPSLPPPFLLSCVFLPSIVLVPVLVFLLLQIPENFPVPTQPVSPPSISVTFERPPSPVSASVVTANIPNGTDTEEHPGASLRERSPSQNAPG